MERRWYCGLFGVALCSLGFLGGCGAPPTGPDDARNFVVTDAGAGIKAPVIDTLVAPLDMVLPIKQD